MRILCISDGRRTIPHLQINYIYGMKKWFDIFIYGPNEHNLNDKSITPLQFSQKLDIIDLCKTFTPDIVILPEYSISKVLLGFLGDLNRVKSIPVVSIEDYIFEKDFWENRRWHIDRGIDYVITREPFLENIFSVPSVWLPWAVDNMLIEEYRDWEERYEKVVFVGEGYYSRNEFYVTRKKAIYLLETNGLLDSFRTHKLEFYREKVNRYRYFLSDSWNTLQMPPCKTFEAMAMGCAVFSPFFIYEQKLFGDDPCVIQYDKECEGLVKLVQEYIKNQEKSKEIANRGREKVLENHLLSHRILELKDILADILGKTEIRRKWGV